MTFYSLMGVSIICLATHLEASVAPFYSLMGVSSQYNIPPGLWGVYIFLLPYGSFHFSTIFARKFDIFLSFYSLMGVSMGVCGVREPSKYWY